MDFLVKAYFWARDKFASPYCTELGVCKFIGLTVDMFKNMDPSVIGHLIIKDVKSIIP